MKKFLYSLGIGAVLLAGCQAQEQVGQKNTKGTVSESEVSTAKSLAKAPNVILKNESGERVLLEDYAGKKIYINVWSTKCGPCRHEIPIIEKVFQDYQDKEDYAFLSVTQPSDEEFENQGAGDTDKEGILSFAKEMGITYPILYDYQNNFATTYLIRAIPTHIFINSNGELVEQYIGGITEDILREQLDKLS